MGVRMPTFFARLFKGKLIKAALGVAVGSAGASVGVSHLALDPSVIEAIKALTELVAQVAVVVAAIVGAINHRTA